MIARLVRNTNRAILYVGYDRNYLDRAAFADFGTEGIQSQIFESVKMVGAPPDSPLQNRFKVLVEVIGELAREVQDARRERDDARAAAQLELDKRRAVERAYQSASLSREGAVEMLDALVHRLNPTLIEKHGYRLSYMLGEIGRLQEAAATMNGMVVPVEEYWKSSIAYYLKRQKEWSLRTFGPGKRTMGVTAHIQKELDEIRANPTDLMEWIDVIILAMDGFWRAGGSVEDVTKLLHAKQEKNFKRQWPTPTSEDVAIEHVRGVHD